MRKIGIIGAGSWGTALAVNLARNNHEVVIWSIMEDEIKMLNEHREHIDKLPGVKLAENISFTTDMEAAIKGMDMLVLAVPSIFTRSTSKNMASFVEEGQIIACVGKGIEDNTFMTITDIVEEEIPHADVCVLCGPSHAEEVIERALTTVTCAATVVDKANEIYIKEAATCTSVAIYYKSCRDCGIAHTTKTFEGEIILPHEYIDFLDEEYLKEMVQSVNETEVSEQEFLSNNIYYYSLNEDRMVIV